MSERNVCDGARQAWDRVTACMDEQARARATMLAGILTLLANPADDAERTRFADEVAATWTKVVEVAGAYEPSSDRSGNAAG